MQGRNRDQDVENKHMDAKGESAGWGGRMKWEIGIDIYTLICIKWITNKNLLYKKIKFKIYIYIFDIFYLFVLLSTILH